MPIFQTLNMQTSQSKEFFSSFGKREIYPQFVKPLSIPLILQRHRLLDAKVTIGLQKWATGILWSKGICGWVSINTLDWPTIDISINTPSASRSIDQYFGWYVIYLCTQSISQFTLDWHLSNSWLVGQVLTDSYASIKN